MIKAIKMKKIIKFILYYSYSILLYMFSIYLIIYNWGKLDKISSVYTYILILLLGIIIGFGLCRVVNQRI
jgi:hypothetical protein